VGFLIRSTSETKGDERRRNFPAVRRYIQVKSNHGAKEDKVTQAVIARSKHARWKYIPAVLMLALAGAAQVFALLQEPEAQAVALGYFACGATVLVAWLGRGALRWFGRPGTRGAGLRFILLGSLGAAWVEFAFWAVEKLTGAVGVAASPDLLLDLLVTMPWYVAMVTVLWFVYRRFHYHWTTVALLGGLYEIGADGIVGHLLGGNAITVEYLVLMLCLFYGVFVVVYAPIVLVPAWAVPLGDAVAARPRWQRALGALLPLLALLPYLLLAVFVSVSGVAHAARPPIRPGVRGDAPDDGFLFGIGYTTAGLATTFADTGVRQVKLVYGVSRWQDVEPNPPQDGVHAYHWGDLDEMVTEYQSASYGELHITLQSKSPCGTRLGCDAFGNCKPSRPTSEHWDDYEAYVRAVVERYDGDGIDDMPGLRYPVRQYEIETEADGWWEGTQDPITYLEVLDAAQRVAREAYPDVQVFPAAMLFYGLFSGEPDEATIAARRAAKPAVDRVAAFNEEVLRHPELFDAVEFHFLGDDYREIAATIRWLRAQMQANGYQKPIYPSDMPSAPLLVPTSLYPETFRYPQDTVKGYLDIIHGNIMTDTLFQTQEYRDIRAWYAGEQAKFTVKLLLTGMEERAAGMQLATMTDFPWMFCVPSWWPADPYQFWSWGIHGMAEVDWGEPFVLCFPSGGFEFDRPRPVFHTLRWFIVRLQGFSSVERLDLVHPESMADVYAYRVTVDGQPIYVLWAEDGVGQVMGEAEPVVTVSLPVASPTVTVTHVITQTSQTEPAVEVLETANGQVTLRVGETPVFVEAAQWQPRLYLPFIVRTSR
jgi:hypothetical protein